MCGDSVLDGHVRHQAGEVDDAAYVALGDRLADHLGTPTVPVLEGADVEGVHQVADALDVGQGQPDLFGVGDVAAHPVDLVAPGEPGRTGRGRRRGHDLVAGVEQRRDQPGTDVAGRPEDEDPHFSPRWRSRFLANRRPMPAITVAIAPSTGRRIALRERELDRDAELDGDVRAGPGLLEVVLAVDLRGLLGALGVVVEADLLRLVEGHHLGERGPDRLAEDRHLRHVPRPAVVRRRRSGSGRG